MSTIKSQNDNKPIRRQAKPKTKHYAVIKTNMGCCSCWEPCYILSVAEHAEMNTEKI